MSQWHRRNIDPNTTNGVWDLHEEATELLLAIYEGLYEEGDYVYSLRLQDTFLAIKNALLWCESITSFENIKSGVKFGKINPDSNETHIKSINDLYKGSTNSLMETELFGEEDEKGSFGLLPDNYTVPCVSVEGDALLWERRWKKRVLLYQKHLLVVASAQRESVRKLTQEEWNKFSPAIGNYQRALLLLWDLDCYTDPLSVVNQEFNTTVPLEGKIRYHLSTGHIYYGHRLVVDSKPYTQEWAVWRKLYESKGKPRRATYVSLQSMKSEKNKLVFPSWDENALSSLVRRWNDQFSEYGITPLHQISNAIELRLAKKM